MHTVACSLELKILEEETAIKSIMTSEDREGFTGKRANAHEGLELVKSKVIRVKTTFYYRRLFCKK